MEEKLGFPLKSSIYRLIRKQEGQEGLKINKLERGDRNLRLSHENSQYEGNMYLLLKYLILKLL